MKKQLISIIIPVKDTLPYFSKCMDSMINQTYDHCEFIIIDDGSSQDIKGFLDSYCSRNKIYYLRNSDSKGPGAARNLGLRHAKGKYVAFCDSDDWVDLNYYETVCNFMEKNGSDICMTSMRREYTANPCSTHPYMCKYDQIYTLSSEMAIHLLYGDYKEFEITVLAACMNKIYKKEFLDSINAHFEEGMYFQGVLFSIFTFLRASRIDCVPKATYHHLRRPNSIIQSFDPKHIMDFEKCFLKMKAYYDDLKVFEKYKVAYCHLCVHYMNIIINEIFTYVSDDMLKKRYIRQLLDKALELIGIDLFFEVFDVNAIRNHIQPDPISQQLY